MKPENPFGRWAGNCGSVESNKIMVISEKIAAERRPGYFENLQKKCARRRRCLTGFVERERPLAPDGRAQRTDRLSASDRPSDQISDKLAAARMGASHDLALERLPFGRGQRLDVDGRKVAFVQVHSVQHDGSPNGLLQNREIGSL